MKEVSENIFLHFNVSFIFTSFRPETRNLQFASNTSDYAIGPVILYRF